MTNVAPQVLQTTEDTEEVEVEVEEEVKHQDRQEPSSSTTSTAPKACKKQSKRQQYNAELSECILNLAKKEDDQVDLELAAIGARIKRKLNNNKINDILDEIRAVTKSFFDRKRWCQEIAAVSVQQPACVPPNAVVAVPPPLLMRQPQNQVQQGQQIQQVQQDDQHSAGGGGPKVLFDINGMAPMQGYDNLQLVTDPENNSTYMKLN